MEDDGALEPFERGDGVGVGVARVDDDGLLHLTREVELRIEQPLLRVARRVVPEVIEADLTYGDRLLAGEQLAEPAEVVLLSGFVWMNADDGVHVVVRVGERERLVGPDGQDAGDARRSCPRDRSVIEHVEVRVCVDHTVRPRRSSSSSTVSGGSLRKSGLGSCNVWPGASSLGAQLPTHER